jgi:hypothetical protein
MMGKTAVREETLSIVIFLHLLMNTKCEFIAHGSVDNLSRPLHDRNTKVRFGSEADMLGHINSVRFAPESRHSARRLKTAAMCQKWTRTVQTRVSRYHQAGSVKNDSGIPTPIIRVRSGGSSS